MARWSSKRSLRVNPGCSSSRRATCNASNIPTSSRLEGNNKLNCVDVLVAGESFNKDKTDLADMISKPKAGELEPWRLDHGSDREVISGDPGDKWIPRVLINSPAVMEMLRHLRPAFKRLPRNHMIIHRPIQSLVSLHEETKKTLSILSGLDPGRWNVDIEPKAPDLDITETRDLDNLIKNFRDRKSALDQLECFVNFMETRIMPDYYQYRAPPSARPDTIRYDDLWYLFRPGDLIYVPRGISGSEDLRPRSTPASQQIFRVIQTCLTRQSIPVSLGVSRRAHDPYWSIVGHFIEHDGASYAPVHVFILPIPTFKGEQKITDLPVYPLSYLEDDQVVVQAQSDGATYVSMIERRFGFYSGWTQTVDPMGCSVVDHSQGGRVTSPQHVESDMLVDFQEAFNAIPSWKPVFYAGVDGNWNFEERRLATIPSEFPMLLFDDSGAVDYGQHEPFIGADFTEQAEAQTFLKEDPLGQFRKSTREAPTEIFLALLPRRFFGYAVLERKFLQLNTRFVRSAELETTDKAFDNLEINRKYKQLILALVKSHFDKIETEKRTNTEIETQDLIRGKGKGVVTLLHGVPGVGKTATAEAVALKWKKPLFKITCGDLGYTAEVLEKSLHEIFRLAHHWGCILLLDEADVFITQRERHDLKRNALVSAFLRVLEYYNGIMFLTTDRAGVLDEAVKSRVHLNLYYDHLTETQTVAIFKQHIRRLREIEKQRNEDENEQIMVLHTEIVQFAKDHFKKRDNNHGSGSKFGRWNGRQIRNAFLIASSLAHYDDVGGEDGEADDLAEPGRKKQKQLGRSQFELVAETTLMYDHYRELLHSGKSDDHVAFEREERAMSSQQRPSTPVRMKSPSSRLG